MAERERFELSTRFPAYCFSRAAPSTTRPPLLNRGNYTLFGTFLLVAKALAAYNKLMHFVRKVFLVLFSGLAAFFLFMTALDASVVRVAGSPEPIKQILAGSGIYESIIPNLLGQAEEESSDTNIAFGSEIIRSAAISTFSGQYLETTTSSIIDSLYRWLDGETQIPDFRIDLTAKKTELAKKVADGIEERVASLPKCTKPISGEFDAFSAKCRPANVSARQAANAIRQDFLNNEDFLSDTVIAADEIKSGSNTPLFADSYKDVPNVYQKFKASPLALGLVAKL